LSLGLKRGFWKADVRGDAELREGGGVGSWGTIKKAEHKGGY